ncbi:conserved hypothetical protein [Oceanicaulis sp. 350]|nr:conserved hypothetical protein [Oceanicaulis sp. 350]
MSALRKKIDDARATALGLLDELGIERVPTPLSRIAKRMGIIVEYTPLEEALSGMAMIKDGEKFAWINSMHHPNRQRFTLAHEIGHHVLHGEKMLAAGVHVDKALLRRDATSSEGTAVVEIEANNFASELLMPEPKMQQLLKDINLEDQSKVAELASRLKVSPAALQFRLLR